MKKILIVDRVDDSLSKNLSEIGFECLTNRNITYSDFFNMTDQYCGLIIRSRFVIDKSLIDAKPNLEFIVRIGSGVENIDTAYAESKGIRCLSTPEGNANAVAEHCLALLLAALRHIPTANHEVRNGEWLREKNKGRELQSKVYGIIGYGHNGKAFAKLLHTLGCQVFCYDRYLTDYGDQNATPLSLNQLMQRCNVISLHINYLPENKYFINKNLVAQSGHPFILINTSRGLVVNTIDVVAAIESAAIEYACLDVIEYETVKLQNPPIEEWSGTMHQLAKMENVILTPHIGGQTLDAEKRHAEFAFLKIKQLYSIQ